MNFVNRFLAGQVTEADIEKEIARWHDFAPNNSLPQYLGLTDKEYAVWVERGDLMGVLHDRLVEMDCIDALQILAAGGKIRCCYWGEKDYLCIKDQDMIFCYWAGGQMQETKVGLDDFATDLRQKWCGVFSP